MIITLIDCFKSSIILFHICVFLSKLIVLCFYFVIWLTWPITNSINLRCFVGLNGWVFNFCWGGSRWYEFDLSLLWLIVQIISFDPLSVSTFFFFDLYDSDPIRFVFMICCSQKSFGIENLGKSQFNPTPTDLQRARAINLSQTLSTRKLLRLQKTQIIQTILSESIRLVHLRYSHPQQMLHPHYPLHATIQFLPIPGPLPKEKDRFNSNQIKHRKKYAGSSVQHSFCVCSSCAFWFWFSMGGFAPYCALWLASSCVRLTLWTRRLTSLSGM